MQSIMSISDVINNSQTTFFNRLTTRIPDLVLQKAKSKSKRPLGKLAYILLLIIKQDCKIQGYCDRSIIELANMSGYTVDGVKKALRVLTAQKYIFNKKRGPWHTTVRVVSRSGNCYFPEKFRKNNKKALHKALHSDHSLYKISSLEEKENKDLLETRKISEKGRREEECFKVLGMNELDELIILSRIKRSKLSVDERFKLATTILARHYKNSIQSPRAYYLAAIENSRT